MDFDNLKEGKKRQFQVERQSISQQMERDYNERILQKTYGGQLMHSLIPYLTNLRKIKVYKYRILTKLLD